MNRKRSPEVPGPRTRKRRTTCQRCGSGRKLNGGIPACALPLVIFQKSCHSKSAQDLTAGVRQEDIRMCRVWDAGLRAVVEHNNQGLSLNLSEQATSDLIAYLTSL